MPFDHPLTPLEVELVRHLAAGTPRIEISRSIGDTYYHPRFANACRKLGVSGKRRTEAALVHAAYRARVLDLPPRPAAAVHLAAHQEIILRDLAQGLGTKAMAKRTGWELGYLERTCRTLMTGLQARTPWGAVSHAWKLRLLTSEPTPAQAATAIPHRPPAPGRARRSA
jgi:hypothetical protein